MRSLSSCAAVILPAVRCEIMVPIPDHCFFAIIIAIIYNISLSFL